MKRWMLVLAAVLFAGMVAGAGYLGMQSVQGKDTPGAEAPSTVEVTRGDVQTTVTAPGHLVNTHETTLSFSTGGILTAVAVRPGDEVTAGTVLAQLDPTPLQERVLAAEAHLEVVQAALDQLKAGPTSVQWAAAQLALTSAEARLDAVSYTHLTLPTMLAQCRSRWWRWR